MWIHVGFCPPPQKNLVALMNPVGLAATNTNHSMLIPTAIMAWLR